MLFSQFSDEAYQISILFFTFNNRKNFIVYHCDESAQLLTTVQDLSTRFLYSGCLIRFFRKESQACANFTLQVRPIYSCLGLWHVPIDPFFWFCLSKQVF